jgi:hypothetical protein
MVMFRHSGLLVGAFALSFSGLWLTSAKAGAVQFVPHRAVYNIVLARASPGSGITDMTGRMVYELIGSACAGYTQKMRFVTKITGRDGEAQVNDLRTSTWEQAEGQQLRFTTSQFRNDHLEETTEGDADRSKGDDAVKVRLTKPGQKGLELNPGVMFPMQHSMALIEAAKRDEKTLEAELYDGSEKGEKVYLTNAFIGKEAAEEQKLNGVSREIATKTNITARSAWPMAISYYESGAPGSDMVPSYELSFHLYDNGISSKLFIDYGEFAIEGVLADLTMLEMTSCERPKGR